MNIIETQDLTRVFPGRTAVAHLNLAVQVGEIYGFLGPNGAGKTTTIRMLAGLLPPSRGKVRVAGHDLQTDRDGARASIGLLPESVGYYGWMTPVEYLQFFADLYGVRPKGGRDRIGSLLGQVGLSDRQQSRITTLSRGMRARLGIARSLVHRPRVLFLDEPILGLDPLGQRDILELIQHVNREEGVTVFLSSHALDQVGQLCARVGILNEGRLVAQGTPSELRRQIEMPSSLHLTVTQADLAWEIAMGLKLYAEARVLDPEHLVVTPRGTSPQTEVLVQALVKAGVAVREALTRGPSLEELFFALIQRERTGA